MSIGWPEGIYLTILILGVGVAIARFGEPKKRDTYDIADVLISPAIVLALLWWGGFFA